MFFNVDGERFRIYSSITSQEAHHRRFLVLMVADFGSLAPTPPRGSVIDDFNVDGGHFQMYSSGTSQVACHQCFLALMVGALGSPAPAPLRGPAIDVF
jgi:hypothetical protein